MDYKNNFLIQIKSLILQTLFNNYILCVLFFILIIKLIKNASWNSTPIKIKVIENQRIILKNMLPTIYFTFPSNQEKIIKKITNFHEIQCSEVLKTLLKNIKKWPHMSNFKFGINLHPKIHFKIKKNDFLKKC